jgi:amidohydrolase family protein
VTGAGLFSPRPAAAHDDDPPEDTGRRGRRYIIRGGSVMSMDPSVGDFPQADVLVEGEKMLAVGPDLRFNRAKALRLEGKTGSLTPGKEADIIILDATRLNVAPLNQVPGAVVSLMDRTNVETVIAAARSASGRGGCSTSAGIPQDLFRSN